MNEVIPGRSEIGPPVVDAVGIRPGTCQETCQDRRCSTALTCHTCQNLNLPGQAMLGPDV